MLTEIQKDKLINKIIYYTMRGCNASFTEACSYINLDNTGSSLFIWRDTEEGYDFWYKLFSSSFNLRKNLKSFLEKYKNFISLETFYGQSKF